MLLKVIVLILIARYVAKWDEKNSRFSEKFHQIDIKVLINCYGTAKISYIIEIISIVDISTSYPRSSSWMTSGVWRQYETTCPIRRLVGSFLRCDLLVFRRFLPTEISPFVCVDVIVSVHYEAARILQSTNASVDPCSDFFEFACGQWNHEHPIPDERTKYDMFTMLKDGLQDRLRSASVLLRCHLNFVLVLHPRKA